MKSAALAAALAGAALSLSAAAEAGAQAGALTPPGEGPLDVSGAVQEVFDREKRIVYRGDVNAVRGNRRLRADEIEVYFNTSEGGGFGDVARIEATGDVYYVTPGEVVRGDHGVYNLQDQTIVLTGNVVLTQGCNVSTGSRLVANLETGVSQLAGAEGGERVRSVFFPERDTQAPAAEVEDCPRPEIPGEGPEPFVEG